MSSSPPAADRSQEPWTIRRVLEWTAQHLQKHGSGTPRLDAEILLAHARHCRRIELYAAYDDVLSDEVRKVMRELVQRRAQSEPVAYLVGHREFFSLDFIVNKSVLIPRPDTETLVMEALGRLKGLANPRVLDLCTGSGCVAISIAKNCPAAHVTATDISPEALAVAQENATRLGVTDRMEFYRGDLLEALPSESRFDVIVSNPPYITTAEMGELQPDVRLHEPALALDGGPEGLGPLRRIVSVAGDWLAPGGWLLLEMDPSQAEPMLSAVAAENRFETAQMVRDLGQTPRVLAAQTVRSVSSPAQ